MITQPGGLDAVHKTSWYGEPAIEVQGGGLTATMVPGRGAKIVSLHDGEFEWLLQTTDPPPPPAQPGDCFVAAEMCGWDECAPTILACPAPSGTTLPDHGELWTARWQVNGGHATTSGNAMPYHFTRTIEPAAHGITLRYQVMASEPMPFLWAAHPQFVALPGTRVRLPATIDQVIDVLDRPGVPVGWPGLGAALATVDTLTAGGCRKVYCPPDRPVGEAWLCHPDDRTLALTWTSATVPYLGLWFDCGAYARAPVIAIEPGTGYYDALDVAVANNTVLRLAPGEPVEWTLGLNVHHTTPHSPTT